MSSTVPCLYREVFFRKFRFRSGAGAYARAALRFGAGCPHPALRVTQTATIGRSVLSRTNRIGFDFSSRAASSMPRTVRFVSRPMNDALASIFQSRLYARAGSPVWLGNTVNFKLFNDLSSRANKVMTIGRRSEQTRSTDTLTFYTLWFICRRTRHRIWRRNRIYPKARWTY